MRALLTILILMAAFPAWAQDADQDIVAEPLCFAVQNTAPWSVYGDFSTDYFTAPDGTRARHRSNFRLEAAGAQDKGGQSADRAEFCSYGPFLPGRKLYLTLRTLVPIFSCKTRLDAGPIVIKGERDAEGTAKTWAECYE